MCFSLNWVLSSCDNTQQEHKFYVGQVILFENGKEFNLPINTYVFGEGTITEQCKITAKMVAMEEYTLDDSSNWPYQDQYLFSYRYRIYVKGNCPTKYAGQIFNHTLRFRTSPYNGVNYYPRANYVSTPVDENGYFEFSVDVYMPDVVTKVIPIGLESL